MPILEQVLYYGLYTLLWGVLYLILGFLKDNDFFSTPFQRIHWLSAFHYATVTPLLVISYFLDPPPFAYDVQASLLLQHVMMMIVGYYIVGIIHSISSKQEDKTGVFHHIAFGITIVILLAWGDFPRFWMWVMVAQFPGVLFHAMLALRKTPTVNPLFNLKLEKLHLWMYIVFRKFYQTLFAFYLFYVDIRLGVSTTLVLLGLVLPVMVTSFILNVIWLKQAIRHIEKEKLKLGFS